MPKFSSVADLSAAVTTRQQAAKTARVTISGDTDGHPDQQFEGIGVLRSDPGGTSMQFALQVQRPDPTPVEVEVRLVVQPAAIFLRPPDGTALPPRKSWLQLSPKTTDPLYQRFLPIAAALRTSIDLPAFFALYSNATTITNAVDEPIDGTRAVRYDLHINQTNTAAPPVSAATVQNASATAQTGMNLQIWLDEHNSPVRTLITEPAAAPGRYTLDAHYNTWGKPVYIGPPDPLQVIQQ
jgi:hypothetical protein